MTSQEFLEWMETMGFTKAAQIVTCLTVSRNHAQRWVRDAQAGLDVDIKPTVALAMSAAVHGLPPWGKDTA